MHNLHTVSEINPVDRGHGKGLEIPIKLYFQSFENKLRRKLSKSIMIPDLDSINNMSFTFNRN